MLGFGGLGELVFIFFLAMLIFGPEKLPEMGRLLAKGLAEVRKASNELKRTLNAELAISEQEAEARRRAALPSPSQSSQSSPPYPAPPSSSPDAPPPSPPLPPAVPVLSTEPPLFPPLEHAEAPSGTGGATLAGAPETTNPETTTPETAAAPVLRPAAMTVPASPPGAPGAAPLTPYGEGRGAAPEQADADVN